MRVVMDIASLVGLAFILLVWVWAILPGKAKVKVDREFFLPPLHGGYKPRPGPSLRSYPPKPPPGPGGGSPIRKE